MVDEDYYALELVKAAVDLIAAKEFKEVEEAFNLTIDRARSLTVEKYDRLAREHIEGVKSDLHDISVQAQGGL